MLTVGIGLVDVGKSRLNFFEFFVLKHAIKKNKNKIEKPILNFKKDQYVGDWFSCSFI